MGKHFSRFCFYLFKFVINVNILIQLMNIRQLLEEKYLKYNTKDFIESDPIYIPHQFSQKENIEIAGFLTATIAWGQRSTIVKNARKLMLMMDNEPYDFIREASESEITGISSFVHRTFSGTDLQFFIRALRHIDLRYGGLHKLFAGTYRNSGDLMTGLIEFRKAFFEIPHPVRTEKHVADISKGASAKRINMFLRWMVRRDDSGVDFGLWDDIPSSALYIPLDVHSGKVARDLGLLSRRQSDWKAVEELTDNLRKFDPSDPVKYDFALFGMGIFEKE